jgi:hypothetical protein
MMVRLLKVNTSEGTPSVGKLATDYSTVTTVGLDIAKLIFQVHGVDAACYGDSAFNYCSCALNRCKVPLT